MRSGWALLGVTAASLSLLVGGCDDQTGAAQEALQSRVATLEEARVQQDEAQQAQLAQATGRIDALEKQLATVENDNVLLRERAVNLQSKVTDLETRADELELKLVELQSHKSLTIGVPECDDYIAKYNHCIDDKLPEAARKASREALELSVDAWRRAAKTPAGREGLAVACKAAADAVATTCGF